MAQRRPAARPTAAAIAASQRQQLEKAGGAAQQGGAEGSAAASSSRAATHIYASSVAVPPRSSIDQLEAQLLERCLRVEPFEQRDVVLQRRDDLDAERMAMEQADSSYGPMRRARIQSRLQVRIEKGKTQLMHFSQAQQRAPTSTAQNAAQGAASSGAAGAQPSSANTTNKSHEPDYIRVKNLTSVRLSADDGEEEDFDTALEDGEGDIADAMSRRGDSSLWKDVTSMMGWVPHHAIARQGRRFVMRDSTLHKTEVLLFQLYKADESQSNETLQRVSDTTVLQVTTTLPLIDGSGRRIEGLESDPAKLTERACSDIVGLHDALRGLVEFGKDVE